MPLVRIVTDVRADRVNFVTALIRADQGTAETTLEEDGEFTVVATYPDDSPIAAAAEATTPAVVEAGESRAPWMAIAMAELGQQEIAGEGSNARILDYHATTRLAARRDSVPWCSSFVNFCVETAGIAGTGSAAARSWLGWGVDAPDFLPGCVVILSRGNPPKGHVGFFFGREGGKIRLLGGNQNDSVSIASYDPDRVIGWRMPPPAMM